VFCDRCGLNFLPKQSVCTRCKSASTRYWFQLASLLTLFVALAANSLVALFLLPRLLYTPHPLAIFRVWWWIDKNAALYGWLPLAAALLAWDYLVWKGARPKVKGWFTRKLLTLTLTAGVAPILPWWVPAGQPPGQFLSMIGRHQALPIFLAWGAVAIVTALICANSESRDYLLGHGKALSLVSLGLLLLVLSLTVVGWTLSFSS
jgi:hypothetical protein